jgi:hypothetical protein
MNEQPELSVSQIADLHFHSQNLGFNPKHVFVQAEHRFAQRDL